MLFPYAECNLLEYMEQQQFGMCTKKNSLWFLGQLRDLADGVRHIYNMQEPPQSSADLTSANQELRKSAWHHDIKPQNILCFRENDSEKGVFRIADFGSGKVHAIRSESVNTKSPHGTVTYEPPEARLGERMTSRPYDIWSLGCVFLELLLWAVSGYESVQNFAMERKGRRCKSDILIDDSFWEKRDDFAVLRDAVIKQLRLLEKSTIGQNSPPFEKVVKLIWEMLNPDAKERIIAPHLWSRLEIYSQKEIELSTIDDDMIP